jgi:hypothetical protein
MGHREPMTINAFASIEYRLSVKPGYSFFLQQQLVKGISKFLNTSELITGSNKSKDRLQSFIARPREVVGKSGWCCHIQFLLRFFCVKISAF